MNPGSRTYQWCDTPHALDRILWGLVSQQQPTTVDTRDGHNYSSMLDRPLTAFLQEHFRGGHVIVKTSTAGQRSPQHEVATTLLSSVLQLVLRSVPGRCIFLADGPAFEIAYEKECRRLQWEELVVGLGVSLQDLNYGPSIEVAPGWPISRSYAEADLVINLTKAKTHRRFGVSLAEKSLLGVLSGSELGYPKLAGRHSEAVWLLRQIRECSPPIFSIIDGFHGMQGEGPLNGTPSRSDFLTFGPGCLSPDIRATVEMGFDPALTPIFHRPYNSAPADCPPHWDQMRISRVNYFPPVSCRWLYRSMRRGSRRRDTTYRVLLAGAKECWPPEN